MSSYYLYWVVSGEYTRSTAAMLITNCRAGSDQCRLYCSH